MPDTNLEITQKAMEVILTTAGVNLNELDRIKE